MKLPSSVLALALAAAIPLTACSQVNAQSSNGPSPDQRAKYQQMRNDAKTAAMNDLSPDHRAKVQAIITKANDANSFSDLVDDAKQIDAILTPDEAKAILGERDKMVAAMQANRPADAGPGPGGQGGPGQAGPGGQGGGMHRGGGMMRGNDAGRFLLGISLDPQKMRELRHKQQQAQPQN
ncbi:MAG TPA: hypothetical protein VMA36_06505 [Candidatus Limnocylindria bacterium]|jgi:hypothetical protein|nr:hypothetical protein [Candidatus Limnocylindria bacterium]